MPLLSHEKTRQKLLTLTFKKTNASDVSFTNKADQWNSRNMTPTKMNFYKDSAEVKDDMNTAGELNV